jgi:hypothetical protein
VTPAAALADGLPFEYEPAGDWFMMFRRFKRLCALWLVAQVLLPFTAPFPTCDLSDFLSGARHHGAPLVPPSSHVDGDDAFAPPLATTGGRLRLVVVSSLDVSSVVWLAPVILPGRPFRADVGGQERPQTQPTVLRL